MITFEEILQRMLDRIPDTVDKREGSIIYDALAPAAAELVQAYIELAGYLDLVFVDTSSNSYLTRLCSQFGIDREEATRAIRKGTFTGQNGPFNVPIGSRYTLDDLSYVVTEKINEGVFRVECETAGTIGNTAYGNLIPIDYIEGLTTAVLGEVLIPGENEETDEELKDRYFEYVREPAFGGNIADYKRKVKSLDGVGSVKVYPVWNGDGTVKLVLLDSDFSIPTQTLIDEVYEAVAPLKDDSGLGIAPVGHTVTIKGADTQSIDVTAEITLATGYTEAMVEPEITAAIEAYLKTLCEAWEDSDTLTLRIAYIDAKLLDLEGVLDVANTTINGVTTNISIASESIPVLGAVNVTYV